MLLKQAKDSTYITGMLTDTQGCFSFDQPLGEYLLHITLIGSEDLYVPVVLQGNKNVGEFGKGLMVPEFDLAVFAAEVGKVVGPVKTQFGYHLI